MKHTLDITDLREYEKAVYDITTNDTVKQMQNFKQHYDTSCYEHCKNVSFYSYLICKKFNLNYISAARAGMLHDLFLYDWRMRQNGRKGLHAFTHPKTALDNASKLFELSPLEQDIIVKHMWPVTFFKFPKYKESYVITLADKLCAIKESIDAYKSKKRIQIFYRYAYVFFSMLVIFK